MSKHVFDCFFAEFFKHVLKHVFPFGASRRGDTLEGYLLVRGRRDLPCRDVVVVTYK